jgi:hypothetical protein
MKHSKLIFGFITFIGIVFLALFFVILRIAIWVPFEMFELWVFSSLLVCFTTNGIIGTVGICGVGRRYFKDNQKFVSAILFVQSSLTIALLYMSLILPLSRLCFL